MTNEELLTRVQEIKDIAKKSRSTTEQVLVDLTKKENAIQKPLVQKSTSPDILPKGGEVPE